MCLTPKQRWFGRVANPHTGKRPLVTDPTLAVDPHSSMTVSCGVCTECRMRKVSDKGHVLADHVRYFPDNTCWFATFTIDPEHLTCVSGTDLGTLVRRDIQLCVKRMRFYVSKHFPFLPNMDIFYAGEYGEKGDRPHFHAIIYGLPLTDLEYLNTLGGETLYKSPKLAELWGMGHISVKQVTYNNCAYAAKYMVKRIGGEKADEHYQGRLPEFCRTSSNIGRPYVAEFMSDFEKGYMVRTYKGKTVKVPIPERYMDIIDELNPALYDRLKALAVAHAIEHKDDYRNTESGRQARSYNLHKNLSKNKKTHFHGESSGSADADMQKFFCSIPTDFKDRSLTPDQIERQLRSVKRSVPHKTLSDALDDKYTKYMETKLERRFHRFQLSYSLKHGVPIDDPSIADAFDKQNAYNANRQKLRAERRMQLLAESQNKPNVEG